MPLNGSGVAVISSSGQPVVATTLITADAFNTLTADLATMISTCIMKDGQQTITQNIPFNNKKITGLAAASARTDAASLATIQDGTGIYTATVGGTADVITLTPSPAITAYAAGQTFRFIASGANTTNVTVAVSGLVAKAITKNGAVALVAGDIPSGSMVEITYDGTRFILAAGPIPTTGAWTLSLGGSATYTSREGTYVKLGRLVFVRGAMTVNAIGTGSTSTVSGLPFAPATVAAMTVSQTGSLATAVVSVTGITSGSTIEFQSRTAADVSDGVVAVFGNGSFFTVSGVYETNS